MVMSHASALPPSRPRYSFHFSNRINISLTLSELLCCVCCSWVITFSRNIPYEADQLTQYFLTNASTLFQSGGVCALFSMFLYAFPLRKAYASRAALASDLTSLILCSLNACLEYLLVFSSLLMVLASSARLMILTFKYILPSKVSILYSSHI